ncbi:hypothetical protein [Tenacibaculum finnmarkense]|uniref:hypothetical protein n=1 Tax=Tenacibaculum finnmarkense TaxID=2781243 RepID=UPI0020798E32|nr:hypothetical protein [Tenacibaculum finnmarkense]MCM8906788.1 hypothetical protein [Tenacibaculum finnmarkense genomovar finnmarkense]
MENKVSALDLFKLVLVIYLVTVVIGLFLALKHEFQSDKNYIKDDFRFKRKPIIGEGKGVIISNEHLHTLEEVNAIKQGRSSKSKCTECNKNKNNH